jgi:hypothetical protein
VLVAKAKYSTMLVFKDSSDPPANTSKRVVRLPSCSRVVVQRVPDLHQLRNLPNVIVSACKSVSSRGRIERRDLGERDLADNVKIAACSGAKSLSLWCKRVYKSALLIRKSECYRTSSPICKAGSR